MPKNCAAVGCTNHNMMSHKKLSFCIFPNKKKQPERWKKWVQALNRINHDGSDWQPGGKYVYLCSEHFMTGKPNHDPDHPDYVPTVFKNRSSDMMNSRKIQRMFNGGPSFPGSSSSSHVPPTRFSSTTAAMKDKIISSDPCHMMLTEPPRKVSGYTQTPTLISNNKYRSNGRTMMSEVVDSLKCNRGDLKRKIEGFERQLAASRYEQNKFMKPDDDNWIHFTGLDTIIFQTFCALIIAQLFSDEK